MVCALQPIAGIGVEDTAAQEGSAYEDVHYIEHESPPRSYVDRRAAAKAPGSDQVQAAASTTAGWA
ncbi:MAG: hypothetical protein JOY71_28710 [Acetobacteraceae bacterium]|nr:hypothetical protein [Acetobacteraceae bacterium]MBV8589737.1 hypothetical protein [Acetobacteraceae bacterium]